MQFRAIENGCYAGLSYETWPAFFEEVYTQIGELERM
jgi:hypothetical protein